MLEIYPLNFVEDAGVPQFGNIDTANLFYPIIPDPKKLVIGKRLANDSLLSQSMERITIFSKLSENGVHTQFPLGEHFQHHPYERGHWKEFGDMRSERSRTSFVLDTYIDRSFPVEFLPITKMSLASTDVLGTWFQYSSKISQISQLVYQEASQSVDPTRFKDVYVAAPVKYCVNDDMRNMEIKLWDKACAQMVGLLNKDDVRKVPQFLHLYAHIKDPVTPILNNFEVQSKFFRKMFNNLKGVEINCITVAQLAQEAMSLSIAELAGLDAIHYGTRHQLLYTSVKPHELPRGELANPARVVEVMRDLVEQSNLYKRPVATPITISFFEKSGDKPKKFIIDGNNRVTAILALDFLNCNSFAKFDQNEIDAKLSVYAKVRNLDSKWASDIKETILLLDSSILSYLRSNEPIIQKIVNSTLPAALVKEPDFNTVSVAESDGSIIKLIPPFNQVIFNDGDVAIASKKQTHGRSPDNAVLVTMS